MSAAGAFLAGIRIFPIKSLDAVELSQATILHGGALAEDRKYALRDADGKFVNAKRFALVQQLRTVWDSRRETVCLNLEGSSQEGRFRIPEQQAQLEQWLSEAFEQPVTADQNGEGGFPDDLHAPGPTLISTATLETVASWYPGVTVEETRRRFRTNLEIAGVPAFWEDRLFAEAGQFVAFRLGNVLLHGVNPCQRCIVPTRDSMSAEPWPEFSQTFRANREASLPSWADRSRFNHFYRLAVNTCIPSTEAGKTLQIGDGLTLQSIGQR